MNQTSKAMLMKRLFAVLLVSLLALQLSANGNELQEKGIDLEISVYPNPATSYVVVNTNTQVGNIKIVNLLGQEVLEIDSPSASERIDLENFASNIYIIIATVDNVRRVARLIIE